MVKCCNKRSEGFICSHPCIVSITYAEDRHLTDNFHINSPDCLSWSGHNSRAQTFMCAGLCPGKCCGSPLTQLIAKRQMLLLRRLSVAKNRSLTAWPSNSEWSAPRCRPELQWPPQWQRWTVYKFAIPRLFPNQLHVVVQKKKKNIAEACIMPPWKPDSANPFSVSCFFYQKDSGKYTFCILLTLPRVADS